MADPTRHRRRARWNAPGRRIQAALALVGICVVAAAGGGETFTSPARGYSAVQVPADFTHADHTTLRCFTCHEMSDQHGALLVTTIDDCRGCHHAAPLAAPCARCHDAAATPSAMYALVRPVSFSVGTGDLARSLAFPHGRHATIECARCHTEGSALAVADSLACEGCHAEHHTTRSDCASCHAQAPVSAHPPEQAHLTCSDASCHQRFPFAEVPRTREVCLACHQTMRMHEYPRVCTDCHILPAPLPQPEGSR